MTKTKEVSLLVTAGDGPVECNQAVGHILDRMQHEADLVGVDLSISRAEGRHGPRSAVVMIHGAAAHDFASSWRGTIQWRMQSKVRKHHRRSNWFVGVFELEAAAKAETSIREADVSFSTLRAGGPGGQHQNTTDSAVRATHLQSGLTVVVRDGRSQHRNKALALERLQRLSVAEASAKREQQKSDRNRLHHQLERGNPVRVFRGERFEPMDS
ncbi:MAG: peptide chain release factor H [Pseudomonadota bacterium]